MRLAEQAAAEAKRRDVRVDTVALAPGTGPDVAVVELSLPADIVPADYTLPGLITALECYFTSE